MTRFTIAAALAVTVSAGAALAQDAPSTEADDPPNRVQGIVTNAFAKGFPKEFEGLVQHSIKTNPPQGTVEAVYTNSDDTRYARIELVPIPPNGIPALFDGVRIAYEKESDMPVVVFDVTSPEGLPLDCFTFRSAEQGYINCFTEIRGRLFQAQMGAVVERDAEVLPEDMKERDSELAALFADSVNAAPDQEGGGADDPLPGLSDINKMALPPGPIAGADPNEQRPQDTPFAKALPESIDGRNLKTISIKGPKLVYIATFDDDRGSGTQIALFADHGDDPTGLRAYEKGLIGDVLGELRDVEATTPGGIPMQCFHTVKDAGSSLNFCTANVDAGIVEVQPLSKIAPSLTDAPDKVVDWAQDHSGRLIDSLATMPEQPEAAEQAEQPQ